MLLSTLSNFLNARLVFQLPLPFVAFLLAFSVGASLLAWRLLLRCIATEVKKQIDRRVHDDLNAVRVLSHEVCMDGKITEHANALHAQAEHKGDTELFRYVQHSQSIRNARRCKSPKRLVQSDTSHPMFGAHFRPTASRE